MRLFLSVILVLGSIAPSLAQSTAAKPGEHVYPGRPVHTFSIVARDPNTGDMGVAVQSHWFSVGTVVAWAEAGLGAVATQSFVEPNYGSMGLQMLQYGRSAPDILKTLLENDKSRDLRQVAMIDYQRTRGRVDRQQKHPVRWPHCGQGLCGPGQLDAERQSLAGDGPGFRKCKG